MSIPLTGPPRPSTLPPNRRTNAVTFQLVPVVSPLPSHHHVFFASTVSRVTAPCSSRASCGVTPQPRSWGTTSTTSSSAPTTKTKLNVTRDRADPSRTPSRRSYTPRASCVPARSTTSPPSAQAQRGNPPTTERSSRTSARCATTTAEASTRFVLEEWDRACGARSRSGRNVRDPCWCSRGCGHTLAASDAFAREGLGLGSRDNASEVYDVRCTALVVAAYGAVPAYALLALLWRVVERIAALQVARITCAFFFFFFIEMLLIFGIGIRRGDREN